MIIQPRNVWTKRLALGLKIILLFLNQFGIDYIVLAVAPFIPLKNGGLLFRSPRFFDVLMSAIIMHVTIWNVFRLFCWMSSLSWNRQFVELVNNVIHVTTRIDGIVGPLSLEGTSLLILYIVQLDLTLLQMVGYSQVGLHLFSLYNLILELFFNTYVVYELLLLSWIAAFNRFLKVYAQEWNPSKMQRLKFLELFNLYSRIGIIHQEIQHLWLPLASVIFSDILMLVSNWSFVISCFLFDNFAEGGDCSWKYGIPVTAAQASLLRILFLGLCNDRLALQQCFLRLQLLVISLKVQDQLDQKFKWDVNNLQTCFNLQLWAQPIRNQIMSVNQECGCSFVLDFFFCALLNALGCVQYRLSVNIRSFHFLDTIT
ncbi:uncharacterized protein CG31750-like [Drosophila teissieri]|uniref:uncharacterized protein CG31750-like n=1 Tax=Drosophila teissieri TaxID=7243 RepID=UPI001CBA434D|nr:uncharacterized protein CG31750-like [Drosophila teissieri]